MKNKLLIIGLIVLSALGLVSLSTYYINSNNDGGINVSGKKEFKKPPRGDYALMNAEYLFEKTRNPFTNSIPSDQKSKELDFASKLPKKETAKNQEWEWRGPANIGGRMLCLEFDVEDENILLAGSASGGMWRSVNQGQEWEKVTAPNVEQSATCLTQDTRPGKTNTWYYGTGELLSTTNRNVSTNVRTIGIGNGIFKSVDNGLTWTQLESTIGGSPGTLNEAFQGVWSIVTDPLTVNKDVVYAACYGAIMRSENGGETWEVTLGDMENKSFATYVTITSDGVLYAALSSYCWSPDRPDKAGVWRSEDGINWTNITPEGLYSITRVMKLAVAPSNENLLYLFTESPSEIMHPFNGVFNTENMFWKYSYNQTVDTGIWENRTQNMPGGGDGSFTTFPNSFLVYGGYTMTMNVKPDDENVVFLAGMQMFRSENGFADTLHTHYMGGYPFDMDSLHQLHSDEHYIKFLPSDPDIMFVANDGGIYKTDDCLAGSTSWNRLNNQLVTTQFYSVCVDHGTEGDDYVLGGLQDNNWYYSPTDNPGEFWLDIDLCYDGFASAIADNREFAVISAYSGNIWTSQFDEEFHTKNISFQLPDTLLAFYDPIMGSNEIFAFYQNFALDPVTNEKFYIPTKRSIWRKQDIKAASYDTSLRNTGWEHLSNVDVGQASEISCISASTIPANRLYFGTNLSRIYRLDNAHTGNPVPLDISGNEFPPYSFVACIDIDPEKADNLIVVFSNYGVQSIFSSEDGGATWAAQGGNLEENPDGSGSGPSVRWVKRLNFDESTVYFAGTTVGLFSTTKLQGDSTLWIQEGPWDIGNVIVDMIDARQSDGFIAIATHGNGVYSTYYDPALGIDRHENLGLIQFEECYPNPTSGETTVSFSVKKSSNTELEIYNSSGRLIKRLLNKYLKEGPYSIKVEAGDLPAGLYYISLKTNKEAYSRKLVVF